MPDPQRDFPRTIWKHFLITMAVFIIITLISKACSAQYDPDPNDTTWVKIRSIAFNHTADEWVKKGSPADLQYQAQLPHVIIHDTVYIHDKLPKCPLCPLCGRVHRNDDGSCVVGSLPMFSDTVGFTSTTRHWIKTITTRQTIKTKKTSTRAEPYSTYQTLAGLAPTDTVFIKNVSADSTWKIDTISTRAVNANRQKKQ